MPPHGRQGFHPPLCSGRRRGVPRLSVASSLPRREIPLSPAAALTAAPPLIAAWLVGLHAQPARKGRKAMNTDVYRRVTDSIVAELEKGVRPWLKPWNAEHAAGRITRPLRANGIPYRGINVLMLWASACERGYTKRTRGLLRCLKRIRARTWSNSSPTIPA